MNYGPDGCYGSHVVTGRNFLAVFAALLAAACSQSGPAPHAPLITAQGFDISEPRVAMVGEFDDVRVRLEVAGKIDGILIEEGSFDSNLAKTLDKDLFRLFGLEQRPYSRSDVTLNFRNYINEKITEAGIYHIEIAVTDYLGQSASQSFVVDVQTEEEPQADVPAEIAEIWAETGDFVFERVGPGELGGAEEFGLTWKTIDPIRVTIRVAAADGRAVKLARLDTTDFQAVHTRSQVDEIVEHAVAVDAIEFDTAISAAAGQIFAVINDERPYILQAYASETSLSEAGTTVVVTGRYKY